MIPTWVSRSLCPVGVVVPPKIFHKHSTAPSAAGLVGCRWFGIPQIICTGSPESGRNTTFANPLASYWRAKISDLRLLAVLVITFQKSHVSETILTIPFG